MITNNDAILWYNVGIFGQAGYAVPNWSNDIGSLNPQILYLVENTGRNLFHIMHHEDADLRIPPSVNTCRRVHKLYIRLGNILSARAIAPGKDNMETLHVRPAGEVFRVFPVPYFKVRNPFMRSWCGLILTSIAEMMQHTENRKEVEISTLFAAQVFQYLRRVYRSMAVELFGKTVGATEVDGFALQDADFTTYNPAAFFTSTEMVDTVPRLDRVQTEDALELLAEGIPLNQLPADVTPWPADLTNFYGQMRNDATLGGAVPGTAGSGLGGTQGVTVAPVIPNPLV